MDLRIPSQVLAATFELALLTWNISPSEASPIELAPPTMLDPSPLPSLSPKHSEQSQHTLSEAPPLYQISNSKSASNINSNTNTNTKTKTKSKSKLQSISYSYFNFDSSSSDDDSDAESTSPFEFDDFTSDYPSFTNPFSTSSKTCTYNSIPTPHPRSQTPLTSPLACISGFETDNWEGSRNCKGQSFYKGRDEFWFPSASHSYSPPISPSSTPSSGSFFSDLDDDDENEEGEDHDEDKKEVIEITSGSKIRPGAKERCQQCESCLYNAVLDGAIKMECRVGQGVVDDGQAMLDWL